MSHKTLRPLPTPRVEIRLAGSGGQGLILAGLVLAEAAGVYDGREVAMVQSYGPEARGGASKAEIIISDSPIDYPLCTHVDILLALNQEACDAYMLGPQAGRTHTCGQRSGGSSAQQSCRHAGLYIRCP